MANKKALTKAEKKELLEGQKKRTIEYFEARIKHIKEGIDPLDLALGNTSEQILYRLKHFLLEGEDPILDDIITALIGKATSGDIKSIEIILNYMVGKPLERIAVKAQVEQVNAVMLPIKLKRDIEDTEDEE